MKAYSERRLVAKDSRNCSLGSRRDCNEGAPIARRNQRKAQRQIAKNECILTDEPSPKYQLLIEQNELSQTVFFDTLKKVEKYIHNDKAYNRYFRYTDSKYTISTIPQ